MKTLKFFYIGIFFCDILFAPLKIHAQKYNPADVAVINALIAKNGLKAKPNAPESWRFARWDKSKPKRIYKLKLNKSGLYGVASFAGLTQLKILFCKNNNLTELVFPFNYQGTVDLSKQHNILVGTPIVMQYDENVKIVVSAKDRDRVLSKAKISDTKTDKETQTDESDVAANTDINDDEPGNKAKISDTKTDKEIQTDESDVAANTDINYDEQGNAAIGFNAALSAGNMVNNFGIGGKFRYHLTDRTRLECSGS
jgi:hypothetical protein